MFFKPQPGLGHPMSDMCSHAFEHSLQGNTGIWLKETENNKKLCG